MEPVFFATLLLALELQAETETLEHKRPEIVSAQWFIGAFIVKKTIKNNDFGHQWKYVQNWFKSERLWRHLLNVHI